MSGVIQPPGAQCANVRRRDPRTERPSAEGRRGNEGVAADGAETVILADDDAAIRKLTGRILKGAGYTVLCAADGAEAVAAFEARSGDVDLAILDVAMPGSGGREAGERMKALNSGVRLLYCTGFSAKGEDAQFVLDEGFDLIEKPYRPKTLLRKVREVLDR